MPRRGTPGYDGRPMGRYAGNTGPPMDICATRLREVFSSLFGPPVARLAGTNDPIDTYYGTDMIPPERFPLGPPAANREADFEGVGFQEITWER